MEMVKSKKDGTLIVVSGPSGAGKGTINSRVLNNNPNINMSISMTTRAPRGAEVNGVDYFFTTKENFEEKIKNNEFLEYATYAGEYYGTPKDFVQNMIAEGKDVLLEIEIQGALQIKEQMPEAIFIFIMPPSMKELRDRLANRKTDSREKVIERFKKAYQEINEVSKYNYVVINDEVDMAVRKVEAILLTEKCRVDRIIDLELNNAEELIHQLLTN